MKRKLLPLGVNLSEQASQLDIHANKTVAANLQDHLNFDQTVQIPNRSALPRKHKNQPEHPAKANSRNALRILNSLLAGADDVDIQISNALKEYYKNVSRYEAEVTRENRGDFTDLLPSNGPALIRNDFVSDNRINQAFSLVGQESSHLDQRLLSRVSMDKATIASKAPANLNYSPNHKLDIEYVTTESYLEEILAKQACSLSENIETEPSECRAKNNLSSNGKQETNLNDGAAPPFSSPVRNDKYSELSAYNLIKNHASELSKPRNNFYFKNTNIRNFSENQLADELNLETGSKKNIFALDLLLNNAEIKTKETINLMLLAVKHLPQEDIYRLRLSKIFRKKISLLRKWEDIIKLCRANINSLNSNIFDYFIASHNAIFASLEKINNIIEQIKFIIANTNTKSFNYFASQHLSIAAIGSNQCSEFKFNIRRMLDDIPASAGKNASSNNPNVGPGSIFSAGFQFSRTQKNLKAWESNKHADASVMRASTIWMGNQNTELSILEKLVSAINVNGSNINRSPINSDLSQNRYIDAASDRLSELFLIAQSSVAGIFSALNRILKSIYSILDNKAIMRGATIAMLAYANIDAKSMNSSFHQYILSSINSYKSGIDHYLSPLNDLYEKSVLQVNALAHGQQTKPVQSLQMKLANISGAHPLVNKSLESRTRQNNLFTIQTNNAIKEDNKEIQYKIALSLIDKNSNSYNMNQATNIFSQLANLGFAPAQFKLGQIYEDGRVGIKDLNLAAKWYQKAAENGYKLAMHNLAVVIFNGPGKKKRTQEALYWFKEAGKRGIRDSQYNLGVIYANGIGVSSNQVEAYAWLDLAARQGDGEARKLLDKIGSKLLLEEIDQAHDRYEILKSEISSHAS